jgi:SAM-dependent methyltransferase
MTHDHDKPDHSHDDEHAHDHHYSHSHGHHHHGHDHSHEPHDWHSTTYVDDWIKRDATREDERRPQIKMMIEMARLPRDAAISVLDVGAGYGFVTEEILTAFPNARVTMQDFSELMLAQARRRLANRAGQLIYVLCDLTDPAWTDRVGGPFDLVVSAIAIHNLRSTEAMTACYRGISWLLKPDAPFLDYDRFQMSGGIENHISLMQNAGLTRVSRAWNDDRAAIITAHGRRAMV